MCLYFYDSFYLMLEFFYIYITFSHSSIYYDNFYVPLNFTSYCYFKNLPFLFWSGYYDTSSLNRLNCDNIFWSSNILKEIYFRFHMIRLIICCKNWLLFIFFIVTHLWLKIYFLVVSYVTNSLFLRLLFNNE